MQIPARCELMKALEALNRRTMADNREVAQVLCRALEAFRERPSSKLFELLQDEIRSAQMWCEDEARRLGGLIDRRRARFKRIIGEDSECGRRLAEHTAKARERERIVEQRRLMLRQMGDALAWVVLGGNHRVIASNYAPQTHQIPREQGLAGALLVEHELMKTGRYYVLETDLVRCLGTGDLVVVEVDRMGHEPLTLELKSSGELGEGLELGVGIGTVHSEIASHKRLYTEVQEILGAGPAPEGVLDSRRTERQMKDLQERTERMFKLTRSGAETTRRPDSPHWKAVASIIDRALIAGSSFEQLEEGVYRYAVRTRDDTFAEDADRVRIRIRDLAGASEERLFAEATTFDLALNDEISTIVAPVALWELSPSHRAAILCGDVLVGNIRELNIVDRHLANLGVGMERLDGGYRFTKDGVESLMSDLEFSHVNASAAFTGVSTRGIAVVIAELVETRTERDNGNADGTAG